jgi:hypothetical protein
MLESTVDLLNGLFFIAMILLTAVCIVGSIVAAIRAVGHATTTSESIQEQFTDDMQPAGRPLGDQVRSVDGVLNPVGQEKARSAHGRPRHTYRTGKTALVIESFPRSECPSHFQSQVAGHGDR